jgi:hypothetical protein
MHVTLKEDIRISNSGRTMGHGAQQMSVEEMRRDKGSSYRNESHLHLAFDSHEFI